MPPGAAQAHFAGLAGWAAKDYVLLSKGGFTVFALPVASGVEAIEMLNCEKGANAGEPRAVFFYQRGSRGVGLGRRAHSFGGRR